MIKKIINKYFQFFPFGKKRSVSILDDLIPSRLSPWRAYEYNEIIKEIENSQVITDMSNFKHYSEGNSYEQSLVLLSNLYPELAKNTHQLKLLENSKTTLFYTIFFHNIQKYFQHFERHKIPFAFTLYPGGGFYFNNYEQEKFLKKVFTSKFFRGVIVNQKFTYNYLLEKNLCEVDKIKLIHGAPINLNNYNCSINKNFNGPIQILFMANKYMAYGFDKGFDIFQLVSLRLIKKYPDITFHVIGSFSESDLTFRELSENYIFHGSLVEENFGNILNQTQICVSPNRPNALNQGAIDGFPLASSITAGYYKNILFLSDVFNEAENINIINGKDFIKINFDPFKISKQIENFIDDRKLLEEVALNGCEKIKDLYSYENQITPRLNFFKKICK